MNCSTMVVCVDTTGEILGGSSFGTDAGPFSVTSDAGVVCEGQWRRTFSCIGLAQFTCNGARQGTSIFIWFEPESGTVVGTGRFDDGTQAHFWGGNNLERHFREVAPEDRARMACAPDAMLTS